MAKIDGIKNTSKPLEDICLAQSINYLEAYGLEMGLLIDFGNTSLQFKGVMKPSQDPSKNLSKSEPPSN